MENIKFPFPLGYSGASAYLYTQCAVITTAYQKATDIRPCFLLQRVPPVAAASSAVQKGERERERERETRFKKRGPCEPTAISEPTMRDE